MDTDNCCVRVFELTGVCLHTWGCRGSGRGEFNYPCGVAVRGDEVLVADCHNNRLQVFRLDGTFVSAWGPPRGSSRQLILPHRLAVTRHGQLLLGEVFEPHLQVLE